MKINFSTAALTAVLAIGGVAATAGAASAHVVCNASGDCWHTDSRASYGPKAQLKYHPDSWYFQQKWDQDKTRHWRESHEGRGYYANGVWVSR